MEAEITKKPAFTVVGLRINTKPKSPEIPKLWDAFVPRMGELQNVSEPYSSYGVMTGVGDGLDYMAGNPVSEVAEFPAGMSRWNIAEATYAVFESSIPTLSETFDYIFGVWLPTSEYQHGSGPLLERYGETFSSDNPVVHVYIPVVKKHDTKKDLGMTVQLRQVEKVDLPIFFEQQLDSEANYMAAFTTKKPEDKNAFDAHWTKILADEDNMNKTILFEGQVAGHVSSFIMFGERNVSYWLGKEFWGKGVATEALTKFLEHVTTRPLYGRAVKDNLASIRVLEKCGFKPSGYSKGFAEGRGEEVEEVIMIKESV